MDRWTLAALIALMGFGAVLILAVSPSAAARIGGMDRRTLRDSVHRFNHEGPDSLIDRHPKDAERRRRRRRLRRRRYASPHRF